MSASFVLDPRLAGDSVPVAELPLCSVRLMNDSRFGWLLLVPRRADLAELCDLSEAEQAVLWTEVRQTADALRAVVPCDKLNLGALGNIVRQLHVHLVARVTGDAAWPGPVWGSGAAVAYEDTALAGRVAALQRALAAPAR